MRNRADVRETLIGSQIASLLYHCNRIIANRQCRDVRVRSVAIPKPPFHVSRSCAETSSIRYRNSITDFRIPLLSGRPEQRRIAVATRRSRSPVQSPKTASRSSTCRRGITFRIARNVVAPATTNCAIAAVATAWTSRRRAYRHLGFVLGRIVLKRKSRAKNVAGNQNLQLQS